MTVVMSENEVHGLDTVEIFRVHYMLATGSGSYFGTKIGPESSDDGIEQSYTWYLEAATALFERPT